MLSVAYGSGGGAVDPRGPESGRDDLTTVTVELSPWASQSTARVKVVKPGQDRDPVARHADLETASIPTELDFGRYRHAQEEVTDFMSIETVDPPAPPRRWRWFGNAPPKPASC